jgi:cytochrome c5
MPPEKDWVILKTYLETNAQVALNDDAGNDFDSAAGKAFKATCSQCHAPPNPKTHTANEWPRVVLRMKSHIIRIGKKMPDQDTLFQIIDFLQKHAKGV